MNIRHTALFTLSPLAPFAVALACVVACGESSPPPAKSSNDVAASHPTPMPSVTPPTVTAPAADAAAPQEHHAAGPPHWAYTGGEGPAKWGDLSPDFGTCKTGTKQTPIDIPKGAEKDKTLAALGISYLPVPLAILNNGHTVQVNNSTPSSMTAFGEKWDLAQFHFHSPSEHTLEGKSYDMELHFVHKNAKGELAVVGVLLKKGKENKALKAVFDNAPAEPSKDATPIAGATIDIPSLVPTKSAYYTYMGSLTTPPCSENVKWFVLATPAEVSEAQIAKFTQVTHGATNRPIQPLGDRKVSQFKP